MKPTLSVVVVSFNTRDLLERCLASVAAEPVGAGAEVWVVDNASADGSAEMVRARFPEVRLLVNDANRGFAAACNQALARVTGEFVLLLNSDAILQPRALGRLLEVLQRQPEVGVVGGQLVDPDGRLQRSYGKMPRVGSFVAEMLGAGRVPGARRLLSEVASPPRRRERPRPVDHVCGAGLAFRRGLLDEIGLLDERFFLYFEETDFCLRVRRDAGRVVWFEPRARVRHERQGSVRHLGREPAEVHYARSAYAFILKHLGARAARRLSLAFDAWLAAQLLLHRAQAVLGRSGGTEAWVRKQRLRRLHRSLGGPEGLQSCPCGGASTREGRCAS